MALLSSKRTFTSTRQFLSYEKQQLPVCFFSRLRFLDYILTLYHSGSYAADLAGNVPESGEILRLGLSLSGIMRSAPHDLEKPSELGPQPQNLKVLTEGL